MQKGTTQQQSHVLVSVIIPSFNSASFLPQTLDSVVQQSHRCLEVIVVDDCSTDNSLQVAQKYADDDGRVKVIQLDKNSGSPAEPRNIGIQHATGQYLAFLDSDDVWSEYKLELQLKVMAEQGLAFSSTYVRKFVETLRAPMQDLGQELTSPKVELISFDTLIRKNIVATSSVVVLNSAVNGIRFSTRDQDYGLEDYKMWLDLLSQAGIKAGLIEFISAGYRVRKGSMSRSKLTMALRVYKFLSSYGAGEKHLGAKRYLYFLTYLVGAIHSKMYR